MADAHYKRIAPRARLGKDLDLLSVHEAELEQSPLERREFRAARAHTHHASAGAGRKSRKAHEARFNSKAGRGGDRIHECKYG
jgi:hypothetical protein